MIRAAFLALASVSLAGCVGSAAAARPKASYAAARLADRATDAAAPSAARSGVSAVAGPRVLKSARRSHRARPLSRVEAANRAAVSEPSPDGYVGALQVYPWAEGALYRLYAAPEEVSDIVLQPGESLVSVAAGDTVRWIIGDTTSGAGPTRRTHILVKPSAPGLTTNLVIATDRRVYHVEAQSTARTAMTSISWTYPDDALLALRGAPGAGSEAVTAGAGIDSLNFGYRIEGDKPPWRPLRAFDDGRQVFIEFPAALEQGEAPPLFVTGEGGQPELVNYRVRGRYYVVDRLFSAAELRLGERHQQIVRIVRDGSEQGRGRRHP